MFTLVFYVFTLMCSPLSRGFWRGGVWCEPIQEVSAVQPALPVRALPAATPSGSVRFASKYIEFGSGPEFLPNLDPYSGLGMFFKTLFCSQFPVLRPGIFNLSLCTIFGRMQGFKPELLRPQPGVLPVSYTHPFLREKIKLFLEKNCLQKFKSVESPWMVNVCL